MENEPGHDLLLNSLETEIGEVQIYETALRCAVNEDFREAWSKYRDQTEHHTDVLARPAFAEKRIGNRIPVDLPRSVVSTCQRVRTSTWHYGGTHWPPILLRNSSTRRGPLALGDNGGVAIPIPLRIPSRSSSSAASDE